jgi:transposase
MRTLRISDAETIILALQDEIRRSHEARYDHRLHAVLLVAQGMSGRTVAQLLGDSPRSVAYWVRRFEEEGLAGLAEADRPGRPGRLSPEQIDQIADALRSSPSDHGLVANLWDGKTLSVFIKQRFGIGLGVRQCQRLFRQLGFRFRKPRPMIAKADPAQQAAFKKNSKAFR